MAVARVQSAVFSKAFLNTVSCPVCQYGVADYAGYLQALGASPGLRSFSSKVRGLSGHSTVKDSLLLPI